MIDIAEILRIHFTSELNDTVMEWVDTCRKAFLSAAFDNKPCDNDVYAMALSLLMTLSELYRISNMDDVALLDYTRGRVIKLDPALAVDWDARFGGTENKDNG